MVKDEPEYFTISQQTYALLAGAVEKLCNDSELEALDAEGMLRLVLLVESPNEFVVRNIFVT